MTFATPIYLLLIPVLLCVLYGLMHIMSRRNRKQVLAYSALAFAERVFKRNLFLELLFSGIILFGVASATFALAGPRLTMNVPQRDGAVVICIDTSGSMASSDILPTRAQAALKAIHLFVEHLPAGVKVGIVSFSTAVDPVLTPNSDRASIDDAIGRIPEPNGATSIGDALLLSEQLLPKDGRRAVVLLTDGVNNRGSDPVEAAQDMAAHHITLYTVGIGTSDSGQIIPGTNEAADADPDALRQYAEVTGGKFAAVKDASEIASAFLQLSREATWQSKQVSLSLPAALIGAAALCVGVIFGLAMGRFPSI